MADYITKAELRGFASKLSINEQVQLRKSASSRSLAGSTFLSHSSKDDDLVVGAVKVLEGHGGLVYIDKKDPTMPPYTSSETAQKLKDRIKFCKKFVLLASENSKESKWVPWELGIGDGYKNTSEIAIFPASEKSWDQQWASWEYLGLYRKIVWGRFKGEEKCCWQVLDEKNNEGIRLSSWLRN